MLSVRGIKVVPLGYEFRIFQHYRHPTHILNELHDWTLWNISFLICTSKFDFIKTDFVFLLKVSNIFFLNLHPPSPDPL